MNGETEFILLANQLLKIIDGRHGRVVDMRNDFVRPDAGNECLTARFNFGDDNLTFFKDRVYEICDEIEKRGMNDLDIRCGNGIRADRVDRALLKRMREVGFSYLAFGVEAGNNRILGILKKGEKIENI